MDIYRVIDCTLGKINRAIGVISEDRRRTNDLQSELQQIMDNMNMMNASIKNHSEGRGQGALEEVWILQLQNLAYDIEDFLDLMGVKPKRVFISRVMRMVVHMDFRPEHAESIRTFSKRVEVLQKWKPLTPTSTAPLNGNADRTGGGGNATLPSHPWASGSSAGSEEPVGMDKSKEDLRELLVHPQGQREQLRVISIVGPRGLGKTTLAWDMYRHRDSLGRTFDFHAWVPPPCDASSGVNVNARDLLKEILKQVDDDNEVADCREDTTDVYKLRGILRLYLEKKRYFIVIDDVRKAEVWDGMKPAFPKDKSSVIITTTSVQSVATACSSGSYVYKLQGLNLEYSRDLFWGNVLDTKDDARYPDLLKYSDEILKNCGGLPLAILSVARFLRLEGRDNLQNCCIQACQLGKYLGGGNHGAFGELQRVLVESYEGLASNEYDLKTCLLSMSMFPKGSDIKRKSLARRWIAEGLVTKNICAEQNGVAALEGFHMLIDWSIIEPAPAQNPQIPSLKPGVKRCRVHGVMLEFLVHKSISKNFASPRMKGNFLSEHPTGCSIRRLSFDGSIDVKSEDLRSIRSLKIVGSKLLDLGKCKHLRVLDLENCTGVNDVLRSICKLLLLKYLSLRGTDVRKLPKEMEKLGHLETLDVRDTETEVIKLPLEVILLPRLAHLFGKFELPDYSKSKDGAKIGRQMRTLAGFVISNSSINGGPATAAEVPGGPSVAANGGNGSSSSQRWAWITGAALRRDRTPLISSGTTSSTNIIPSGDNDSTTTSNSSSSRGHGFQYILHHMKKLKKVKIWWRSTEGTSGNEAPSEQLTKALVSSLEERFLFSKGLESLSLHFEDQRMDFLDELEVKRVSILDSIKLHGKLSRLPRFITKDALPNLSEVHLSSTGLCSNDLLVLKTLSYLKYLKIVEDGDMFGGGSFDVNKGDFPSLKGLFVKTSKLPQVNITDGGMPFLTTLQLICGDIYGFPVTNIAHLKHLDQVVLKSSLDGDKKAEWIAGTKKHDNRPRIVFLTE